MLDREPLADTWRNRLLSGFITWSGEAIRLGWQATCSLAAVGPRSPAARRYAHFGDGTIVCFPSSVVNPQGIRLGEHTVINRHVTLSAGWMPDQPDLSERTLVIGSRCLIGSGSSIVAHRSIEIGDDVWTGHDVHVTDMNHGYEDVTLPISRQHQPEAPVVVGDGSWLGHGVVVLPGSRIGRHVAVGAGAVVAGELPDFSVAVGVPARVVRRYVEGRGWIAGDPVEQ